MHSVMTVSDEVNCLHVPNDKTKIMKENIKAKSINNSTKLINMGIRD